jgi:hypothetical protein
MPRTTPAQAGSLVSQVREGCGNGRVLANGQCVLRRDVRVARRDNARTNGTGGYPSGMCYRQWDQDARNNKYMSCSSEPPAYVDTPGVRAIVRARDRLGSGPSFWYPYATGSGIICMPGAKVTMGGREYLCQ